MAGSGEQAKIFGRNALLFFLLTMFFWAAGAYFSPRACQLGGASTPGKREERALSFSQNFIAVPDFSDLSNLVSSVIQSHNRFIYLRP